jgi:hypothetical protein
VVVTAPFRGLTSNESLAIIGIPYADQGKDSNTI